MVACPPPRTIDLRDLASPPPSLAAGGSRAAIHGVAQRQALG